MRDDEDLSSPIIQSYLSESLTNLNNEGLADAAYVRRRSLNDEDLVAPLQPLVPPPARKVSAATRAPNAVPDAARAVVATPKTEPAIVAKVAAKPSEPAMSNATNPAAIVTAPAKIAAPANTVAAVKPAPPAAKPTAVSSSTVNQPAATVQAQIQEMVSTSNSPATLKAPAVREGADDIFKQYWRN